VITEHQLNSVIGGTAAGADGKLGTVGEVYLDDETGRPEWATVRTGMFGTKESFVPLADADLAGDEVRLPYDKDKVKHAPQIDTDGHLSPTEEAELYRYYGIGSGTDAAFTETTTTGTDDHGANGHGTVGHDTSGPTTDDAMTRSEERLNVGTRSQEVGRARLRKYVVTENVTETVPVSREEVRLEREPITDANVGSAMDGPAISEEEHEVVLHAETPVVEKEAVPVERVRLDKTTVTEQEQVSEGLRKEEIDVEGDTERRI
jgi:uncharacterized protein (TIGR02271 family)